MIMRTWRGATRAEDAEAYLAYLHRSGLPAYRATAGNLGVAIWTRQTRAATGTALVEFLLCSRWVDREAIERFAGKDISRAVFYPEDPRYLVERDEHVMHYELAHES